MIDLINEESRLEQDLQDQINQHEKTLNYLLDKIAKLQEKYDALMMEWNGLENDHDELEQEINELKEVLRDIGKQARNSANFGNSYEFFDRVFWRDILEKLDSPKT